MSENAKKYLTIAVVALAVIVVDKFFKLSDKTVAKLHGGTHVTAIRAVK